MNIKDFLVDNYIYIIIVILLIIITIIGFLADKKKNGDGQTRQKKSKGNTNQDNTPIIMSEPISYQPINNSIPNNTLNVMPQSNQNFNQVSNMNVVPNNNQVSVVPMATITPMPEPIPNMNQSVNSNMVNTNIATPSSINIQQQTIPNMPPKQTMANNQINQINPIPEIRTNVPNSPQPVEPINQNISVTPEPMYQPLSEQKPTFAPSPVVTPVDPLMNNVNNSNPSPLNYNMNNNLNIPAQGMNQSEGLTQNTISKVNYTPQEMVSPSPIPNPTENTIPNPINPPQPVTPQPVNFVYGPQQQNGNNNPYM